MSDHAKNLREIAEQLFRDELKEGVEESLKRLLAASKFLNAMTWESNDHAQGIARFRNDIEIVAGLTVNMARACVENSGTVTPGKDTR